MARKDIRSNGRNIPLIHHSARGNVQRNSGNFTRGSQLLTHEMLMWFSGAKLPFLLWFFVFLIAFCLILAVKLDERSEEHTSELQSLMRISYAVFCLKKKKQSHRIQMSKL